MSRQTVDAHTSTERQGRRDWAHYGFSASLGLGPQISINTSSWKRKKRSEPTQYDLGFKSCPRVHNVKKIGVSRMRPKTIWCMSSRAIRYSIRPVSVLVQARELTFGQRCRARINNSDERHRTHFEEVLADSVVNTTGHNTYYSFKHFELPLGELGLRVDFGSTLLLPKSCSLA